MHKVSVELINKLLVENIIDDIYNINRFFFNFTYLGILSFDDQYEYSGESTGYVYVVRISPSKARV